MSATITTPVVDYHHLRLLAEWASSVRDREVAFEIRDGALRRVGPETSLLAPALRVPARTPGRSGDVRALILAVDGAAEPIELKGYDADALFWSESAVEKFLVPYYASCAGPRAAQVLAELFDAWNGDHGGVRVVALAHLAHTGGDAPLTLGDTLGVVYRDEGEGTLAMLPLGAFARAHPERWTPAAEPRQGLVELGRRILGEDAWLPAYPDLRGLAEWASSLRGRTGYLAYDPAPPGAETLEEGRCSRVPDPGALPARQIVIPIHTPAEAPDRPRPAELLLYPRHGQPVDLLHDPHCDALFISTGAIEQFLFPYYASVRGAKSLGELRQMLDAWTSVGLAEAGEAGPLALVHLPQSDWDHVVDPPTAAGSPLDEIGVAAADGPVLTVRRWPAQRA
jgi:hypothetical protein